ncbi:MAG: hypothetical protein WBQ03_10565 [Candidatus Sulfotelmatobacter sp.]
MRNEFPMNDSRNIWKDQTTEAFKVSADELRRKARQRERKSRFEAAYSVIIGLFLFVFFGLGAAKVHDLAPRIGFGVLSIWGVHFAYQACKRIWRERLLPDATLNTTLQSYRSELEKRRDYTRHFWHKAGLTFVFVGMVLVVTPPLIKSLGTPRLLLNFAPLFGLLAVWCAIFFPKMKRNRRKLQQEIEELRGFERETRA